MIRARLLSLVGALFGATQLFWLRVWPVDVTELVGALAAASCVFVIVLGLAGTLEPDRFGPDYAPTWFVVLQVVVLAGVTVSGAHLWL